MFELLTVVIFVWLVWKAIGLAFRLTWGIAKFAASVLIALAMPLLAFFILCVGGAVIILPIILVAIALWILRVCVD